MNKRKIYSAYLLVILIVLLTTACGPRFYKNRFNIGTSYKKWVKEIGLFSHKNVNVQSYEEDDDKITLYLEYEDDLDGYGELCDIINAHNRFVEGNPDYFPKDMSISFLNVAKSEWINSLFGNFTEEDVYSKELGISCNSKIQFMALNISDCQGVEVEPDEDIHFDIPVIILSCNYVPSTEEYAFLTEFDKAEQVIFSFEDDDYDREEVCKAIRKYLPEVNIYESVYDGEQSHLRKL